MLTKSALQSRPVESYSTPSRYVEGATGEEFRLETVGHLGGLCLCEANLAGLRWLRVPLMMVEGRLELLPGWLELPPSGVQSRCASRCPPAFVAALTQWQREPVNTQTTCLLLQGGFLLGLGILSCANFSWGGTTTPPTTPDGHQGHPEIQVHHGPSW